jgi:hypothetical protein
MRVGTWKISERLEAALAAWLEQFEAGQGRIDYPMYPSGMWSLGGSAGGDDGRANTLPACYSAGFYRCDPKPKGDRLIFVPSRRFGFVVFLPCAQDVASDRRHVDFDGEHIVVR